MASLLTLLGKRTGRYNNPYGQYFAAGRLRTPTSIGTPLTRYSAHKLEFYSPSYPTNNFRCGFPAHYTKVDGSVPSEFAAAATALIEGHSLQAFVGGSWVDALGLFGGSQSVSIDASNNSIGVLGDEIVFAQDIPPKTRMAVVACLDVPAGQWVSGVPNITGTLEGAFGSASSTVSKLTDHTAFGGTGRIAGRVYGPSYITARAPGGIDRPVWKVPGDSIGYGKNELENIFPSFGDYGYVGRALGDDTRSKRMAYSNVCVPGAGALEWQNRSGWSRKLDLIRLCPNRPYTDALTEHYNNSMTGDYLADFKPSLKNYLALLRSESTAWGDAPCPIYQTRPLPRPGSTDWCTSLAGQTPSGAPLGGLRYMFDDDLVNATYGGYPELAGCIATSTRYSYDQGANRDKIKTVGFQTTLAADYTTGVTVSLTDPVSVGDYLVFAPSGTYNVGRHVTAVTGSGPYTATLEIAPTAMSAGTGVRKSLSGDSAGLHPATVGHRDYIAEDVIDWKNAHWPV